MGTCARCRKRPTLSEVTGCLCGKCEDAVEGMTQAELDADYEAHGRPARHPETALPDHEPCSNVACTLRAGHGGGCANPALDPPYDAPTYTRPRLARPADTSEATQ